MSEVLKAGRHVGVRSADAADAGARTSFDTFVRLHWATLITIGVAVTGSRSEAEDVVQTALTGAWRRWSTVREQDALAYLRRSIANANISRWRRYGSREVVVDLRDADERGAALPDHGVRATDAVDERRSLLPVLRALPARQRAVLVLRYLCDLSDDDIAETLGISTGTVRSQAARGLATLRSRQTRNEETAE